ncbi:hypothetical protein GCM10027258_47550 [Amycolatopsis stemonae]
MAEPETAGNRPRVFVSYAHDSVEHGEAVREFATFLREKAGVDAHLDVWYTDARRDWVSWTIDQLGRADFVFAIASPQYRRIVDGSVTSAAGRTTDLEAAMLRDDLVRDLPGETRRILPVLLPGHIAGEIPACLCGHSTTHYAVPELTLTGVGGLLSALTGTPLHEMPALAPFVPPEPGVVPIVAGSPAETMRTTSILTAEAEVEIGGNRYLLHGGTLETRPSEDLAAIVRQARALRIGPPHEHVWVRQVEHRKETAVAKAAAAALTREHDLLGRLRSEDQGFPQVEELVDEGGVVTSVLGWPRSQPGGGPAETLAAFIPHRGEAVDCWRARQNLLGLAGLCRTLAILHSRGATHRLLTPASLIRFDDGGMALRDLGLAATTFRPGEGAEPYRAAEQRIRSAGRVGPWTDVHQVAAVAYHLVTGSPPDPAIPLPVRGFGAGLPARTADAIDAALATDPSTRPGMPTLAEALRAVRDHRQ